MSVRAVVKLKFLILLALLWAFLAFVMNWYYQTSPLTQLFAWLAITAISLYGAAKGIARIWRGQTVGDLLNAMWE